MTLDQIDRQIEDWKAKLAAASDNLLALYDHPTYKRLTGGDGQGVLKLTGSTAAQVTPALAAMDELFAQMGLLTDVVEQADKLRSARSRFPWSDRQDQQIAQLLDGPSVELPPIQTPLEQRGLLTLAQQSQAVTPAQLLGAMTQAFDAARKAVFAVDAAWTKLDPMLAASDSKLSALEAMAKSLGGDAVAATSALRQELTGLRLQVESDPLATAGSLDGQFAPALATLRGRLERIASEREKIGADLDGAQQKLAQIEADRAAAQAALERCRQSIADVAGLRESLTEAQIGELRTWLETLDETRRRGQWKALAVGIARWNNTAAEYAAVQTDAMKANEGRLDLLAELQGRLSAMQAKANARGLARIPYLAQLSSQAAHLLAAPPVPIDDVAKLIGAYERAVDAAATK